MFCKFMFNSKIIFKSMIDLDDTFQIYLQAWTG